MGVHDWGGMHEQGTLSSQLLWLGAVGVCVLRN